MKTPNSFRSRLALVVATMAALTPLQLHAQYLDPGASSILLQGIIAGVVAVAAVLKLYWWKISGFLTRRQDRDKLP